MCKYGNLSSSVNRQFVNYHTKTTFELLVLKHIINIHFQKCFYFDNCIDLISLFFKILSIIYYETSSFQIAGKRARKKLL